MKMNGRVLVVDDDKDWTAVLRHMLERKGFRVSVASDGRQAIETALQEKPGVVLMDMVMPSAWGHDACRFIKKCLGDDSPKIVMLTALKRAEDRARALSAGADAYLMKPVQEDALLRALRGLTGEEMAGRGNA